MSFLSSQLNLDFIWNVVASQTAAMSRRGTGRAERKFNCPMCLSRGETRDTRQRCALFRSATHFGVYCQNCRFASRFELGKPLSRNMQDFLASIGVPEREIAWMKYYAREFAGMVEIASEQHQTPAVPTFDTVSLPAGSRSIEQWLDADCHDADFNAVTAYMLSRGDVAATATKYFWTPSRDHNLHRHLIIPCFQDERRVGWIGRSIDAVKRKYYNQVPSDYLFNINCLSAPNRKYVFVVEGVFDALVIDGVAAMRAHLSPQQIRAINCHGKQPVVIPDRDQAGRGLVEAALQEGWGVAFTNYRRQSWWDNDIKDVDEAVRRYGKLYTLRSIVESITSDPVIIKQRMNYL
jgi:hypothetical protein